MNKTSQKSQRIETFPLVNPAAAGIDVSDKEHIVAVSPTCCLENVRKFGSFTADLVELVNWLKQCGVQTVAMESTGVYWINLFLLLEEAGLEVYLVNARHVKNVTGRKSDESDAAWIQKLHSCGLLRASFQPDRLTRCLRSTVRHRKSLVADASRYLNRMQKALEQMNLKVHTLLRDLAGKSGQRLLQAILAGERDTEKLASLMDVRVKASKESIQASLQGYWREEHLFELRQCYELYQILEEKIKECDELIEQEVQALLPLERQEEQVVKPPIKRKVSSGKRRLSFNLSEQLAKLLGVNVTQITGISEVSALEILAECGPSLHAFPSGKHFTSWLGLAPNTKVSAGKILSSRLSKKKHRAGQAFRMAASSLHKSQTPLGNYLKRIKARQGPAKAIVATARKIALIYYQLVTKKEDFNPQALIDAQNRLKEQKIRRLEKQLEKLKAA